MNRDILADLLTMKFAANISWLFKEEANLLKRFALAKSAGFRAGVGTRLKKKHILLAISN